MSGSSGYRSRPVDPGNGLKPNDQSPCLGPLSVAEDLNRHVEQ